VKGDAPAPDPRRPSDGIADLIDWFDGLSRGLVLLEPYPLSDLGQAVDRFARELEDHVVSAASGTAHLWFGSLEDQDHARFRESVTELRGLLSVVEHEDQGGHRQALGQYGRILAEAYRDHRMREHRTSRRSPSRGTEDPSALP